MSASQRIFDAIGAQLVLHRSFGDVPPRVGDDYEITEILGAGGFGLICRATQRALRRQVALKLFPLDAGESNAGVREALREARSLARLEHPSIVTVYAAGESEVIAGERLACAYVEMQLIDGVDLREWLTAEPRDAAIVLELLRAAGRALAHAHEAGIVHRDFKPENLMIDRHGKAKVIDFGLALVAEGGDAELARWDAGADAIGTRATGTGLIRGTPGYMAPEASQGRPRAASDQFALAVVIREALTGWHPFAADEGSAVPAPEGGVELFARIKPIIDRAMSPSPGDRFASVAELCDALELPVTERAAATPKRRRRWPTIAIATASLGVLGATAWLASESLRDDPAPSVASKPTQPEPAPEIREPRAPEPEPEPEQPEPAQPEQPASQPDEPSSCNDLSAWMGTWQAATKVFWTEYAYQLDWRVDYELELALAERCSVTVIARKYPPLVEGEPPGAPIETTVSAVALRESAGVWRLPLRLAFPDDTRTYASAEYYETVLLLDRAGASPGETATPRLRGAYRKLNEDGLWVRLGLLAAERGVAPDPRSITTDELACAARCRVACGGATAEAECYARGCSELEQTPDICGPTSYDFRTPMRAVAAREALRDGKNPFAQALERGGKAKQLADCARNARTLTGRWGLWLGDELTTVELRSNDCELAGTITAEQGSVEVDGYVTAAGTWVLTPRAEPPPPPWLNQAIVLVGVGEHGPAFGTETAEPPRQLRAFRVD